MKCSSCNSENRAGRKFCAACGTELPVSCPRCSALNEPGDRFCGECGNSLDDSSGAGEVARSTTGERKVVTALFADIEGSMSLIEHLDPEEARAVIEPALQLMIQAARRYEGHIVQSTGDGIFAVFGAPIAHEDHPQRAIHAALGMQREIKRYKDRLRADKGLRLEVRVGINTGEVVVRPSGPGARDADFVSITHAIGLAARMQTLAPGGSVAVTASVSRLCEGFFTFKSLGVVEIKGAQAPLEVFEVSGLAELRPRLQRATSRGLTPFVGRESELAILVRGLDRVASGRGQVVAVMAEPGVGKSRLFLEFREQPAIGRCLLLEAFAIPHGRTTAYLPLIEPLQTYFGIVAKDDGAVRRGKISETLARLDPALEDTQRYVCGMLGLLEAGDPLLQMDAELRRRRTHDAVRRILVRLAREQPVVILIEDLHWIDPQTRDLLNILADGIATASILLLVNYRPEFTHDWSGTGNYSQLRLDPLAPVNAQHMLVTLLGDAPELAPLMSLIAERTDGNPFFMEEIVQALFEQGFLSRNGTIRLAKPIGALRVPPTVRDVLASRIDRLPAIQKELVQTLAVVGRRFPGSLISRVIDWPEGDLDRELEALQTAEFIHELPSSGGVDYIFKHALTQEVAYNSVLIEQRLLIHERVARGIEELHAAHLDQHVAELAYHCRHSSNVDKAVHYTKRSAEQAAARSALPEAEGYLRDAIKLLLTQPPSPQRDLVELDLQTSFAAVLSSRSYGTPEKEAPLQRARELCERVASPREVLLALFQLGQFYIQRSRLKEAMEVAEQAIAMGRDGVDPLFDVGGWNNATESAFWLGDIEACQRYAARALELCEAVPREELIRAYGLDLWLGQAYFLGLAEAIRGRLLEARQWERRTLERLAPNSQPFSRVLALLFAAVNAHFIGDTESVLEQVATARPISEECGLLECIGWSKQLGGWAHFWSGEQALGMAEMRQAIQELPAIGSVLMTTWRLVVLADAEVELGMLDAAARTISEALASLERTGERFCEAELYRVAARLAMCKPGADAVLAEAYLRRAIVRAQAQGAKLWELRATRLLAALLRDTGRRNEARTTLGAICGRFGEDTASPDVRAARSLLRDLR